MIASSYIEETIAFWQSSGLQPIEPWPEIARKLGWPTRPWWPVTWYDLRDAMVVLERGERPPEPVQVNEFRYRYSLPPKWRAA